MTQPELEQLLADKADLPRTFECEVRVDDAPRLVAVLASDALTIGDRVVQRSYTVNYLSADPGQQTTLKATGRQLSSAINYEVDYV
jgi:hypothetical protein